MKTIDEIFKTNPDLLDTPEVKELIEQFRIQFMSIKHKHTNYWDKVTSLTMNSEFFVKEGLKFKDTVEQIHNISFNPENI